MRDHPGRGRHDETERLVPLREVQDLVLSWTERLSSRELPLDEADGAVLSEDIVVPEDVPRLANSAMDGYAVRAADTADAPVRLEVLGVVAAGAAPPDRPVGAGETLQIMTGAAMPAGADAVAIVERTAEGGPRSVVVLDVVEEGANIRPAGSDFRSGMVALRAGTPLGPGHLGVLAALGRSTAPTFGRPRVGVMSTGDELVAPGEPLRPGQIRDSNRVTLLSFVRRDGFEAVDLGTVADDKGAIEAALEAATERCDAVLSSGGVSKGEYDFVKVVLDKMASDRGGTSALVSVAIRPAKPLAVAALPRHHLGEAPVVFFGLPGNPVSSVVSYRMIALPALRKMAGVPDPLPSALKAVAAEPFPAPHDDRVQLVRVEASVDDAGRLTVRSSGGQQSHQLSGLAGANALAVVAKGADVASGDLVDTILLGPLA